MKTFRFVLVYARKYVKPLVLTVVSMVLLVGGQLVIPWIVRSMIAEVQHPTGGQAAVDTMTRLALLALAIYLLRAGLQFVRSYMAHVAGWGVVSDCRRHVYEHLQQLSLRFYADAGDAHCPRGA